MKSLIIDLRTGNVGLSNAAPDTINPRSYRKVTEITPSIQAVLDEGGPFQWVPADPENPEGDGELVKVELPEPLPASIHRHKFLGQLARMGHSPESIEAAIKQTIPEGPAQLEALNEFHNATNYHYGHPMLAQLAPLFGINTEAEMEQFFRDASKYEFGKQE